MRRTDSIELLQKLSIVNPFYTSLQEQDLQQFTHEQLKKLAAVLDLLNPTLLEGENKKINEILVQRSYAQIKKFNNKYKGFKFNVNMFEHGYHRQLVENRFKKPNESANPQLSSIGVANIEPYKDIVSDQKGIVSDQKGIVSNQENEKQTPDNQVEAKIVEVKRKNRDWNSLSSDQQDYAEVQQIQDEERAKVEEKLKEISPKLEEDQDSQDSFSLNSNSNDSDRGQKMQMEQQKTSQKEVNHQQKDFESFQEDKQIIISSGPSIVHIHSRDQLYKEAQQIYEKHKHILKKPAQQTQTNPFQIDYVNSLSQDIFIGIKTIPQAHAIQHEHIKKNWQDSDDQSSYSLDQSQINQDPIKQWANYHNQQPTYSQNPLQDPLQADQNPPQADRNPPQADQNPPQVDQNHPQVDQNLPQADEEQSIQSFNESDDDQNEDFQDMKNNKINLQKNKQIHPTVQRFHQYCQQNKEKLANQDQIADQNKNDTKIPDKSKNSIQNHNQKQNLIQNPIKKQPKLNSQIDYMKDRQWR